MEKDIFKSILCDKLEKAVSHKYVRKEPDGKGGFKYYYTEAERESTSMAINRHGDRVIEKTGTNPAAVTKGLKNWLNKNGIDYDYNKARTTASSYFEFNVGNGSYEIRVSNHTKPNADETGGLDVHDYGPDKGFSVDIDTSYGFNSKDIQNIIKDTERIYGEVHKNEKLQKMLSDENLLERYYKVRYFPSKTEFIESVVNNMGVEESEFGILGEFVKNMFDKKMYHGDFYEKKKKEEEEQARYRRFYTGDPEKDKKIDEVSEKLKDHEFKTDDSGLSLEEFREKMQSKGVGEMKDLLKIGERISKRGKTVYTYGWAEPMKEGMKRETKPSYAYADAWLKAKEQ